MKNNAVIYLILLSVLLIFIGSQVVINVIDNKIINGVALAIQSGITVMGAIAILYQLKRGRDINELDFFIRLKTSFVNDTQMMDVFKKLQHEDECEEKGQPCTMDVSLSNLEVSRYLDFFDSVYISLLNKVVCIEMIDNAFSYFFFIAVHNKRVHELELHKYAEYYKDIYLLYDIWMKHRKQRGYETLNEETPLVHPKSNQRVAERNH
jgi:hypothetical protein